MFYSIQFLRGIAALMVVIAHTGHKGNQYNIKSFEWFHIGGSGVDLFFIISGFIMCYTTHNKDVLASKFIQNRIQRILPLYWVLSFFALIGFLVFPNMINSSGGTTDVIASFFLIPNGSKFLINNGWTLSYEFYYYFIFAIFILITSIKLFRYIGVSFVLLVLVLIGLIYRPIMPFFDFLTNGLLFEFFLGILAFLFLKNNNLNYKIGVFILMVGVCMLIYINFIGNLNLNRSIVYGIPMFLVFIGFVSLESFFSQADNVAVSLFEHLGNSSYSLYLVHPFVLAPMAIILKKLHISNSYIFSFSLLLGSVVCGYLTYLYLEKPLIKLVRNYKIFKKNKI